MEEIAEMEVYVYERMEDAPQSFLDEVGEAVEMALEKGTYMDPRMTCTHCADRHCCSLVWDGYNTHGDCLAAK